MSDAAPFDKALEHAWRYFALHAQQRIAVFNFFVVMSGILSTAIAATLQYGTRMALMGVVLGLLLSVFSLVFQMLDRRVSTLIKHAEAALAAAERESLPLVARLVALEAEGLADRSGAGASRSRWSVGPRTYGGGFRLVFGSMGLFGLGTAVYSLLRCVGSVP